MKHRLILFWVDVLLFAITTPAVATPVEPADGS